ncbi:lysine decarboxylase [Synechococcus sp. A15-127]|jgi:arginine/lysine/ornithine decarboxylase|uniref:Orn/Lys/Arg family decarboxylase n=1 Tax=Synechococcus sp. A15-127 TaxID=1050624 RepID=UPI0016481423|nr:lysine decarboxylase [Synechococcus sp. A15-127]QNI94808.1 lysine decarboxylase [Synechococcus sp. A15-127]
MTLVSLLRRGRGRNLFLPAHGRGAALPEALRQLLRSRAGIWDLPELPTVGGPLEPEGAVADSQADAAAAMGVKRCWFGVNGATGLLQAALLAIGRPGEAVLLPRNVHRSLIQACLLGDLTPVLYDIPFHTDRGQPAPMDASWLQRVLRDLDTPVAAAVLVHPTYQGYARDPEPLIRLLQGRGWPVLVDEAHGSHFAAGVDPLLPSSAVTAGADLVVHSLQKSAAGLAQTGVLWLQGGRVDPAALERSLGWLQTSSPSALLLASCETALAEWGTPRGRRRLQDRLNEARGLKEQLCRQGLPLLDTQDPLRLVLHSGSAGISGVEADAWLLPRGLVAELPEPATLTFCLGLARHRGLAAALHSSWRRLIQAHPGRVPQPAFEPPPLPLVASPLLPIGQAWRAASRCVPLAEAEGGIAAELLCPYPPGIPLLIPGERLDRDRIQWLLRQRRLWGEQLPASVRITDNSGSMTQTPSSRG